MQALWSGCNRQSRGCPPSSCNRVPCEFPIIHLTRHAIDGPSRRVSSTRMDVDPDLLRSDLRIQMSKLNSRNRSAYQVIETQNAAYFEHFRFRQREREASQNRLSVPIQTHRASKRGGFFYFDTLDTSTRSAADDPLSPFDPRRSPTSKLLTNSLLILAKSLRASSLSALAA